MKPIGSGENLRTSSEDVTKPTPKPAFSSISQAVISTALHQSKTAAKCTITVKLLWPFYIRMMRYLKRRGLSDAAVFTLSFTGIRVFLYWSMNSVFEFWRRTGKMEQYRLPRTHAPPTGKLLRRCWTEALVGQFIVNPLVLMTIGFRGFRAIGGMPSVLSKLPSVPKIFGAMLLSSFLNEWGFYWVHRAVHEVPGLYKAVHKQHHEFKSSIGFAAEYAHPLDQVFANALPTVAGGLFFGHHPLIFFVWLAERLMETYEAHSGYLLRGSWWDSVGLSHWKNTAFHDHHHAVNMGNYGFDEIDYIFGTDTHWKNNGGLEGYLSRATSGKKNTEAV